MKKCLLFGSFVLGLSLFVGCAAKVEDAPVDSEAELQEQEQQMEQSMDEYETRSDSGSQ